MATAKYEYYDNPDAAGRRRRYRTWWGEWPTEYGPADVELVSAAPADPHPRGQAGWDRAGAGYLPGPPARRRLGALAVEPAGTVRRDRRAARLRPGGLRVTRRRTAH